jgi:hypothetical protein
MCFARFRFSFLIIVLSLNAVATGFAQMKPGDRRKAFGEVRASIMESILTAVYPGAKVQWEPDLMVQMPGDKARAVQVPVSVRGNMGGGLEGVATIEFEGSKERFISEAQNFQRSDSPGFSTVLVVFRADTAFRITKYKKVMLDPAEALTEIKTMSIEDWSEKEWPTLNIQYDTHLANRDSFTTIEWHGVLDATSSQFVSRLPYGISRKVRGGPEQSYSFSIGRTSPSNLLISDQQKGISHQYACYDPCVVDGRTLLSEWVK